MGFYKNIGQKGFDDVERYIKERGWEKPVENDSMWYSFTDDTDEWHINKVKLKDGVHYFIEITVHFWGSHFKEHEDITDIMPILFDKVLGNNILFFSVNSELEAASTDRSSTIAFHGIFYDTENNIHKTQTFTHKLKYRRFYSEDTSEREYIKEQNKLRRKFSSQW